jgi:hypothetical protein
MKSLASNFIIIIIKLYQKTISLFFTKIGIKLCRFEPTCSNYAILAIKKYGLIGGLKKTTIRLIKCNPFNSDSHIDYP